MFVRVQRFVAILLSVSCFAPAAVLAAGIEVLSISPSDRTTVFDHTQITHRRVNLPTPADCTSTPAKALQCQDISVLNTLDGFNIQPRISIAFSGAIDVSSVNSDSVFLLSLGSAQGVGSFGDKVGINQVVWDPATKTLHVESDELLEQHTRYAVIVTNRVRDASGAPVQGQHMTDGDDGDKIEKGTRRLAVRVVGASVFTTLSVTSTLEKVQGQINSGRPDPANFNLGTAGERTVFAFGTFAATFNRQNTTGPALSSSPIPIVALGALGPVVSAVAFGSYLSPDYNVSPGEFIPPVGTRTGAPAVQRTNTVYFNLILPAGPRPSAGWPVAIFGHGFGDNRNNSPFVVAASMAAQGIATIAINVVGHGGGAAGTITVDRAGLPTVTLPAGGRGIDQNGDGAISSTEGSSAGAPRILIGSSDGLRQTTIDLMQLVRLIQTGGIQDLDGSRIYYFGQSFGGIYGTIFLGVERDVRVGVPNVAGGAIVDIVRLSPVFRLLFVQAAAARGLLNAPPNVFAIENLPLRDQAPVINNVPGAIPLQEYTEQAEWASQSGNPVAYAPYIRKSPLHGNPAKSVIFQIAKGDQTVPNPTGTAIIRAGDLQDRVTYFRNDIAFAANPTMSKNPHTFLTNIAGTPGGLVASAIAFKAQNQIATFFATNGAITIDPDDAPPALPATFPHVFETPIIPPLPETLNFIP